jgi:hypothetical protein
MRPGRRVAAQSKFHQIKTAMKRMKNWGFAIVFTVLLLGAPALHAADAKGYQVTGPVLEVTDTTVTVQKGDDKWQIARDKSTKIDGQLKVGAKVTVYYKMIATDIEVKDDKKKK